jgi:hypothetical protein
MSLIGLLRWTAWVSSIALLGSGPAFSAPAPKHPSAAAQKALAQKDSCYGWFYSTALSFRKTKAGVIHASEGQQPCAAGIEKFKAEIPAVPAGCEKKKLKAGPPLLLTQLKSEAETWNKRGWQKWEVKADGLMVAEFGKASAFYLRELQSNCDTRR